MTLRSLTRLLACSLVLLLSATAARAQATRTFVSGVGDDVNPCSRTAPCKTFAGTISKTAGGGEMNVLDAGGFGAVTITKSMTIDGEGPHAGILASGTNAININAAGIRVVLRNLHLEGWGTSMGQIGINILAAESVLIENVKISNFGASTARAIRIATGTPVRVVVKDCTIIGSVPLGVSGGIDVAGTAAVTLHVRNTTFVDFFSNSIRFAPPSGALYVDDVYESNTAGVFVQNARASINRLRAEGNVKGVLVGAGGLVTVRDSNIIGNGEGLAATAASAIVNVENTVVSHNNFGISASGGSTFRISNSGILSNAFEGMFNSASFIVSLGGNTVQGNPVAGTFTSTVAKQ